MASAKLILPIALALAVTACGGDNQTPSSKDDDFTFACYEVMDDAMTVCYELTVPKEEAGSADVTCQDLGALRIESCPTENWIGDCVQSDLTTHYYTPAYDDARGSQECTVIRGTWTPRM